MPDHDLCAEPNCEQPATVKLHDPRGENRLVCTAHARVQATATGVVAEPIDEDDWD